MELRPETFWHNAYLAAVIFQPLKDMAYQQLGLYLHPSRGKVYTWPSCYLCRVLLVRTLIQINAICNADRYIYITVRDLSNALPGNSSVNTVQHATIEEAVFSADPTDAPIDWLDSGHVCLL
jgi:hypothetical protein